jgi:hypothetical protein
MLMKVLTVAASVAVLAAPLSSYAGGRHKDGKLITAEAEGIGQQVVIGEYTGTLRKSDGDQANLGKAWFDYKFSPDSNIGNAASNSPCYLDSFTLDIHRDPDNYGPGGNLHLAGTGVDCIVATGHSIQNFVYYVVKDGDGCYSRWKKGRGTGNLTSDTVYTSDWDKELKSILHLDGNLTVLERED